MKLRFALAAATCLALPLAAHAQPVTGPYVNLEGGTGILFPISYSDSLAGTSGKLLYKSSYNFLFGAGYGFGNGFRVETTCTSPTARPIAAASRPAFPVRTRSSGRC